MKKYFIFILFLYLAIHCGVVHAHPASVSFNRSMKRNKQYYAGLSQHHPHWITLRKLYDSYLHRKNPYAFSYRIPPIIHFIWLGSPLPDKCKMMIDSWKKQHPGWVIKIWTDEDVPSFKLKNQKAFDRSKNYGEKSDIWRYEILHRYGGVYVDTDFECLQPFDRIHKSCELFTGVGYTQQALLYNGLIGCIPRHPLMELCIRNIKEGTGDHNPDRIMETTGPKYFTRCFLEIAKKLKGKAVPFPITYFYPFPNYHRTSTHNQHEIKRVWAKKESYAIHYWAASWEK